MRDPLANYTPGLNFWDDQPQLIDVEPFATLYRKDKTAQKNESSKTMWWVVRVHHVSPFNTLRNSSMEQRRRSMSITYFQREDWHTTKGREEELLKPLALMWELIGKSDLQKEVEMLREALNARRTFLAETTRTTINSKELDAALLNGQKLNNQLKELEAELLGIALKQKKDTNKASPAEQKLI